MKRKALFLFLLGFAGILSAFSAEYTDGFLSLVLDENTGRFSLFFRSAESGTKPPALFAGEDPRTSFLSVMVNDRIWKIGDSSAFRIRAGGDSRAPSLIFESPFLRVTEEFSFVKEPGGGEANGAGVTITLENLSNREVSAGARFLLDTSLSEKSAGVFFTTDRRAISSEALITRSEGDSFWTDKNEKLSLRGSLFTGAPGDPDSVHFANWKKLSGVTWKVPLADGRNFTDSPYSVKDAAVCYYYEPRPLAPGGKRSFGFTLAPHLENGLQYKEAADQTAPGALPAGILTPAPASAAVTGRADGSPAPAAADAADPALTARQAAAREKDLAALKELMARIDAHIAAGTASEEELAAIEAALSEFRAKYGSGELR